MGTTILLSFFAVSLFGVLLHFTHKWFKKGVLLHIFSAINESTWEHTKLSFYPILVSVIIHYFINGFYYQGYWGSAFLVMLASIFTIPLLYYPIRFIIGKEVPAVSISLYFVCIAITFGLEYYLVSNRILLLADQCGLSGIVLLILIFATFTYYPPKNFLFLDPIYKKYGEFKQKHDKKH